MSKELIKFWKTNNLNKGLLLVSVIVLICVIYSLSRETFMLWHFPEAASGDYKSMKVKKFPAGFQDPNSIYIDKFGLPVNVKTHPGVYISNNFALPPPAKAQDNPPAYTPPNPFARLNHEDEKEGYGGVGPFSISPRYGISPNYCSIGVNGKSCYAENCKDCQAAFEQDTPLNGSVKAKASHQMYN